MSGQPPHGFEKLESGESVENLTDERLAEEIGEWFVLDLCIIRTFMASLDLPTGTWPSIRCT